MMKKAGEMGQLVEEGYGTDEKVVSLRVKVEHLFRFDCQGTKVKAASGFWNALR